MSLLRNISLLLLLLLATAFLAVPASAARDGPPLEVRLESGGMAECWRALTELRSCTNEIVLFFLNGESYLTLDCCRAIRLITHNCWPAMLSSLGFTSQEADILRGYCDAETAGAAPPSPTTPLPPLPAVAPVVPPAAA